MTEPEPSTPARKPGRKAVVVAGVAALALGLDITTKALVVAHLTPGEPVHVIGDVLEWNLLRNSGAAFSFGTGYTAIFTLLAMVVVGVVIRIAPRLRSTGYAVAFGLLLAGAMGNLGDRIFRAPGIFRGDVVDWIEVTRYYPVFNLADSAICVAAVLFVVLSLLGIHMDGTRYSPGGTQFSPGGTTPLSTPRQRGETPLSPPSPGEPAQTAGPRDLAPTGLGSTAPSGPRDLAPTGLGSTAPSGPRDLAPTGLGSTPSSPNATPAPDATSAPDAASATASPETTPAEAER